MWKCPKCSEELEDNFDICWNCSTERMGAPTVEGAELVDDAEPIASVSREGATQASESKADSPKYRVVNYSEYLGVKQLQKSDFESGAEWAAANFETFINEISSEGWEYMRNEMVFYPVPDVPNAPPHKFQLVIFRKC